MDARDELAQARKKIKRKYRRKRLGVLLKVLLAVLCVLVAVSLVTAATFKDAGDFVRVLFPAGSYPVELSGTTPKQIEDISMGYAVRTRDSVLVLSRSGALLQTITPDYSDIGMACSRSKVLVYYSGGKQLALYNRTQNIFTLETEQPIISCAVGAGRLTAVLCTDERYTASLSIYNTEAERLFTWYAAADFPYAVVFDKDASHVAVLSAYISGGVTCTRVTVISIGAQTETLRCELPFLAIELTLDNNSFSVIGNTAAAVVNADGEIVRSYEYPANLICYCTQRGGNTALAFGDNSMASINTITVLDENMYERCTVAAGREIRDMQLRSGRVYVLSDGAVTAYTVNGDIAKTFDAPYNAIALVVFNKVVVIMPDTADTVG